MLAVVGSAAEARPLLASMHFDAVLVDMEMPVTDGLTLATDLSEGRAYTASMLILISAAENQTAGQTWPFDGFRKSQSMAKPWLGSSVRETCGALRASFAADAHRPPAGRYRRPLAGSPVVILVVSSHHYENTSVMRRLIERSTRDTS